MYQYLIKEKKEYILSKQILRSGTSIGANAHEAAYGASAADFAAKMQIALKETAETEYWLNLLVITGYVSQEHGESMINDCIELKKMLISTLNTVRENNRKNNCSHK